MHNWYECKVTYDKTIDGKMKKVTEGYLVDAISYTEAETRIIQEQCQFFGTEYIITNIKKAKLADIFASEAVTDDRWYNCRIRITLLDESKGVEKKVSQLILVQADNVETAIKRLNEGMKGTISDYTITSVAESTIVDYFPYKVVDIQE